MSSWSCPHDLNGVCQRVAGAACDPGMRGCELHGKVRFAAGEKNLPRKPVPASTAAAVRGETGELPPPARSRRRVPF